MRNVRDAPEVMRTGTVGKTRLRSASAICCAMRRRVIVFPVPGSPRRINGSSERRSSRSRSGTNWLLFPQGNLCVDTISPTGEAQNPADQLVNRPSNGIVYFNIFGRSSWHRTRPERKIDTGTPLVLQVRVQPLKVKDYLFTLCRHREDPQLSQPQMRPGEPSIKGQSNESYLPGTRLAVRGETRCLEWSYDIAEFGQALTPRIERHQIRFTCGVARFSPRKVHEAYHGSLAINHGAAYPRTRVAGLIEGESPIDTIALWQTFVSRKVAWQIEPGRRCNPARSTCQAVGTIFRSPITCRCKCSGRSS